MERSIATFWALIFLLVCDYLWISSNQAMYKTMVESVQKRPMFVNIPAAMLAYVFVALAFVAIVTPKAEVMIENEGPLLLLHAAWSGALVGLLIYGVYNATNMAIFSSYMPKAAIVDTLWGTSLFSIATCCYVWLRTKTKN